MSTPLCVLLVDDSQFFLELERHFLRNTQAMILAATCAAEALSLARSHQPSLVYMDIDMPGVDGLAVCREFKADAALKSIPLVLIGDQKNPGHAEAARQSKADAYLAKPLDRRLFLDTGHSFLVSVDRREPRHKYDIEVDYICRGRQLKGRCIDLSSGGLFLACSPTARSGEMLHVELTLPDAKQTRIKLEARVAWVNDAEELIKPDFPYGLGIEFVNIAETAGIALRRCFVT